MKVTVVVITSNVIRHALTKSIWVEYEINGNYLQKINLHHLYPPFQNDNFLTEIYQVLRVGNVLNGAINAAETIEIDEERKTIDQSSFYQTFEYLAREFQYRVIEISEVLRMSDMQKKIYIYQLFVRGGCIYVSLQVREIERRMKRNLRSTKSFGIYRISLRLKSFSAAKFLKPFS